jgi:hypothetical protein
VVLQVVTKVSNERITRRFSETPITTTKTTRRHNPDDRDQRQILIMKEHRMSKGSVETTTDGLTTGKQAKKSGAS